MVTVAGRVRTVPGWCDTDNGDGYAMTELWENVRVGDHWFGLLDAGEIQFVNEDWSNGLVRALPSGAMIYTGIDTGPVRVQAVASSEPPTAIDPGPWDEVVEISIRCPHGSLRVDSPDHGAAAGLPLLSSSGPGDYRVRVHARGREQNYDRVLDSPAEDYLIVTWPAPMAPDRIVQVTDQCGRQLRQASERHPAVPTTTGYLSTKEQRHRTGLHNAILRGMGKGSSPSS